MSKYKYNKDLKKILTISLIALIIILTICILIVNKLKKDKGIDENELVLTDPVYINEEKR